MVSNKTKAAIVLAFLEREHSSNAWTSTFRARSDYLPRQTRCLVAETSEERARLSNATMIAA